MSRESYKLNQIKPGWNFIISLMLVVGSIIIILPLVLVVIISFSSTESISLNGYSFFPTELTTAAYQNLAKTGSQIVDSYIITILYTLVGTFLSLFFMSMYAFVLSLKGFPGRKFYTFLIFVTMIFSGGLVPSYIVNVRYLNLYDSFWVIVLPSLISGFHVIILRTFINTTIPDSLLEAAEIDGANDFRVYWQIVLPLFKAGLATIALFNVVSRWNNWFSGMLYIEDSKLIPLQTMLQKIQRNVEFIKNNADVTQEERELLRNMPTESVRMAITVITTVPILFAYPFFQRYFITGMTIGSVKG
ncbi:MAG: carbohydrate ABC transporter permease [Clostridiales bacterium]|nr:carbohydrate ABC transporter permease [Clostridiales bacterium]